MGKKLATILLIVIASNSIAQKVSSTSAQKSKYCAGVDVVNALTFLKKNSESYLLNFRDIIANNYSLRFALNLDLSNGESDGYYPDIKFGVQKNKPKENWNWFYGVDASFSYFKSTTNPNETTRYGLSGYLGVEYYFNNKVSLVTEQSLNYYHYRLYNGSTFDLIKERNYDRLVIGSVGMVMLFYHF